MKSVIFSEEHLNDLKQISDELFSDEHDPRSSAYIRKLNRPSINWAKIILFVLAPVLVITAAGFMLKHLGLSVKTIAIISTIILFAYIVLTIKKIVICSIKIYQRYAPDSLRNKCRFEPSCSEYMILAIEKYGLIKGLRKGIGRLKRCNINGGGFDFP